MKSYSKLKNSMLFRRKGYSGNKLSYGGHILMCVLYMFVSSIVTYTGMFGKVQVNEGKHFSYSFSSM